MAFNMCGRVCSGEKRKAINTPLAASAETNIRQGGFDAFCTAYHV
jgi:hypothetical protein